MSAEQDARDLAEKRREFRILRPWADRDAVFDDFVKTQSTEEPSQFFAASYDGEFYGHHRLGALFCPDEKHDSPEVFIYDVHDEDYSDRNRYLPEKITMRRALKASSQVVVNSRAQARAIFKALVAAWGPEVAS